MLLHFAQSVPVESVLAAPATAVLGLIALLLVVALVATLRALIVARRNGNGHTEASDEIAKNIALIEKEGIDLPKNWREYVDARIKHHDRNRRAVVMAYVHLLERGHNEQVIRLLRDEADEG
jgi:hypothetical protein